MALDVGEMKMRDLIKDLEICNKASEGPWEYKEMTSKKARRGNGTAGYVAYKVCHNGNHLGFYHTPEDAKFVVAAREGWPKAIRRAILAEAVVGQLQEKSQEELLILMEKQRAKRPAVVDECSYFVCRTCRTAISYTCDKEEHKYCLSCGQKFDWGTTRWEGTE